MLHYQELQGGKSSSSVEPELSIDISKLPQIEQLICAEGGTHDEKILRMLAKKNNLSVSIDIFGEGNNLTFEQRIAICIGYVEMSSCSEPLKNKLRAHVNLHAAYMRLKMLLKDFESNDLYTKILLPYEKTPTGTLVDQLNSEIEKQNMEGMFNSFIHIQSGRLFACHFEFIEATKQFNEYKKGIDAPACSLPNDAVQKTQLGM